MSHSSEKTWDECTGTNVRNHPRLNKSKAASSLQTAQPFIIILMHLLTNQSGHLTCEEWRDTAQTVVWPVAVWSLVPFIKAQDCIWFPPTSKLLNNLLLIKKVSLYPVCSYCSGMRAPSRIPHSKMKPGSWAATTIAKEFHPSTVRCLSDPLVSSQSWWNPHMVSGRQGRATFSSSIHYPALGTWI